MSEPDLVTKTWTYIGQRRTSSKKLVDAWLDHHGEERLYDRKGSPRRAIGSHYEIECTEDSTRAVVSGAKYLGPGDADEAQLARWVIEDRSEQAAAQLFKAEEAAVKKAGGYAEDMTLLEARLFINSGSMATRVARAAAIMKVLGL